MSAEKIEPREVLADFLNQGHLEYHVAGSVSDYDRADAMIRDLGAEGLALVPKVEIERLTAALTADPSREELLRQMALANEARLEAHNLRAALSRAEAQRSLPIDDETRQFADSALPRCMIDAGMDVLESADSDLKNYVPGETIDWDYGMIAVAVYRAMTTAFLETPDLAGVSREQDQSKEKHDD